MDVMIEGYFTRSLAFLLVLALLVWVCCLPSLMEALVRLGVVLTLAIMGLAAAPSLHARRVPPRLRSRSPPPALA